MVSERDSAEDVAGEALLCFWLLESLLPEGRGELEEAILGPPAQEAEDIAEVSPGLDAVELAAGEEGDEDRVDAGAFVAAEKQPVLATEDLAAEVALGDVVVEGEAAVVDEAREGDALVPRVANRLRDRGLVEDDVSVRSTPS